MSSKELRWLNSLVQLLGLTTPKAIDTMARDLKQDMSSILWKYMNALSSTLLDCTLGIEARHQATYDKKRGDAVATLGPSIFGHNSLPHQQPHDHGKRTER